MKKPARQMDLPFRPGLIAYRMPKDKRRHGDHIKLSDEKAEYIRQSNESISALAKKFSVSRASIYNVLNGETWR